VRNLILTAAAMGLLTVAAHAQTSFLGVQLNQPISASVPACGAHAQPGEKCWTTATKPNEYRISGGNPLGGGYFTVQTDDSDRVIYVEAQIPSSGTGTIMAAMKMKYGEPYVDGVSGALWNVGENKVYYVPDPDSFVAMTTPDWDAARKSETTSLANKF